MARTPSRMLPLGTPCPSFALPEPASGRVVQLADFADRPALVVTFICNHCPYVVHVRDGITRLAHDFLERGAGVVAINANSEMTHPQDGPASMAKLVRELGWRFPFLFDASQDVARAFDAACTPEFYLFDAGRRLVYRGQMDDARPGNDKPNDGRDLRAALDATLTGAPVSDDQKPSVGCNIKWNPR